MKLLMISGDRSILAGKRGAFWYTLEEFSKHWERIDVICPRAGGSFGQSEVSRPNISDNSRPFPNVHFHPSPHSLWRQARWIVRRGKQLITEHHHDIMTVHEYPPFYNGIGARWLTRLTGVPHVLEIHHIVGYPRAASFSEWIGRMLSFGYLPGAIRQSSATRVVNRGAKHLLEHWGAPAAKITVVPSFYLDAEQIAAAPAGKNMYDVVFAGRLVANKGLRNVLRAVESLPDCSLLIVGDGPERAWAEKFVDQKKLQNRVTFTGWLPGQSELYAALKSAKIFVMASTSEGGPRVVLEAMACGVPVIATPVGVVPDVIRDRENGLLTTGEPKDLAENIATLLHDESLRERMGRAGTEVVHRFERKKLIPEYAEFLKNHARISS